MTDDERLARLTELARRIHGPAAIVRTHPMLSSVTSGTAELLVIWGPNHLDALEAALLVLAGEHDVWAAKLAADSVAAGEAEYGRLPAWVEELAQELEDEHGCGDPECMTESCFWAKRLRQRAKG